MLDPKSSHWRFAAGNAFRALETQVRRFDFDRYANGHTYSGLNPSEYIDIIDGFLSESENVVPGGNRTALEKLRKLIVDHVLDAFKVGGQTAIKKWNSTDSDVQSLPNSDLHALARELSPFTELKTEWFIEGFCQSYAQCEFESIRDST